MKLKAGKINTLLLFHVFTLGGIYLSDLILYGKQFATKKTVYKNITDLIEKELLLKLTVKKPIGTEQYEYLLVSLKGKRELLDLLDDKYFYDFGDTYGKGYKTKNQEQIRKLLMQSRTVTALKCCGVKCLPYEKPSLYHLYFTLRKNQRIDYQIDYDYNSEYRDDYEKEQIVEELNEDGYFYSALELRHFIDQIETGGMDSIAGSTFKGIYINNDQCAVVYAMARGDTHLIKIRPEIDARLYDRLKIFSDISNCFRNIPQLNKKEMMSTGTVHETDKYFVPPTTLVLCDSKGSGIYTMATGYPYGRIKSKDKSNAELNYWIKSSNPQFENIKAIPINEKNVSMLDYLLHVSKEDEMNIIHNICADSNYKSNFTYVGYKDNMTPEFPFAQNNSFNGLGHFIDAVFVPSYDVTLLSKISKNENKPLCIITRDDMVDAIAHCVRKECDYYIYNDNNFTQLKHLNKDDVLVYDRQGYPAGEKMILDLLKQTRNKPAVGELKELPNKLKIDKNELFNGIYRGDYDVISVAESITTVDIKAKKRYVKSYLQITLDKELTELIKDAAANYELTPIRYIKKIISLSRPIIVKDAQTFQDKHKEAKINTKQVVLKRKEPTE